MDEGNWVQICLHSESHKADRFRVRSDIRYMFCLQYVNSNCKSKHFKTKWYNKSPAIVWSQDRISPRPCCCLSHSVQKKNMACWILRLNGLSVLLLLQDTTVQKSHEALNRQFQRKTFWVPHHFELFALVSGKIFLWSIFQVGSL